MSEKTYVNDERRMKAALAACDGLPTEWLERGLIVELYKAAAFLLLCDRLGERKDGSISFPENWWVAHGRGQIDTLNAIAKDETPPAKGVAPWLQ